MSQMYVSKGLLSTFDIVVARANVAVNLTGATLTWNARRLSPSGEVVISKSIGTGIVVIDAPAGKAKLTLQAVDTVDLTVEQLFLYYELVLNDGSGPDIVDSGTLQVTVDNPQNLYIAVADVRGLGITMQMASDALVLSTIQTWQQFIERVCRQWFYPLELEMIVDGTDSDAIHFGVPVISISILRLNNDTAALNPIYYKIYNNLSSPADRQNPRVKLIDNGQRDIYTAPMKDGRLQFRFGRQNQYIKGVFGYVEADGGPPLLIKRALTKLVVEKLSTPVFVDPMNPPVVSPPLVTGVILEEWTDGHKIKYGQAGGELKPRAPGLAGITNDPEVLGILRLYKAPIGVATANNPSFR